MSPTLTTTDLLEHDSPASEDDNLAALALVPPAPRHGRPDRFAFLHALFTRRLRGHRATESTSLLSREPEPPLDVLARKYPDIYMTSL